jgi:formate hydrogenlyase transcriptional activator
VAATDSTVLIRGETGTGKAVARAIHNLSARHERTLVKILRSHPTGLLESELFGQEGAFTGAIAQRIGRFELAIVEHSSWLK